jgi:hypothetical protein
MMVIKKQKYYLRFTLVISILLGILFPLALGVKDLTLIAIIFTSVWFIYSVIMFVIVFFVKPGLEIRAMRYKNPTIVRFGLIDSQRKE